MTSVRLSPELEAKLNALAVSRQTSKSELIKEALELLVLADSNRSDVYDVGRSVFGRYGSGTEASSADVKLRVKEKIRAKHASR